MRVDVGRWRGIGAAALVVGACHGGKGDGVVDTDLDDTDHSHTDRADTDLADTDLAHAHTDDTVPVDETDPPGGDSDTGGPVTCPDLPLDANPYACGPADPAADCTQGPLLQDWLDAACAYAAQWPGACLPPRVPCTLADGRTATVILHDVDDVMSWPVYDAGGVHVATFVGSDTPEFCGPSTEAWFGDPAYRGCLGVMAFWESDVVCDTDLVCP